MDGEFLSCFVKRFTDCKPQSKSKNINMVLYITFVGFSFLNLLSCHSLNAAVVWLVRKAPFDEHEHLSSESVCLTAEHCSYHSSALTLHQKTEVHTKAFCIPRPYGM